MPQLFLRDPRSGAEANLTVIHRRLTLFIAGDYRTVLKEWCNDARETLSETREVREDTAERRTEQCIDSIVSVQCWVRRRKEEARESHEDQRKEEEVERNSGWR